jgi:pseudouridine synthase
MEERLQKLISQAGIASRRKAEELIEKGLVTVNGKTANLGDKADPEKDDIRVAGRRLKIQDQPRYILLNKKRGVVSTVSDPEGRPTVVDAISSKFKERVYPVGRLDYDSDGLIILTNDGDLTNRLTHPRYGCEKTYKVLVEGIPSEAILDRWRQGGLMLDTEKTAPCRIKILGTQDGNTWLRIIMREGKNRQIRRIAEMLGFPVLKLTRTHIGSIEIGALKPGQFRELTPLEVRSLKQPEKPKRKRL